MAEPTYFAAAGRYEGRCALITGGANGLGFATAARLAAEGAHVGVVDLLEDQVETALSRLRDNGARVDGFIADVTDQQAVGSAVAAFKTAAGAIDVLVAMAAIYPWIPFEDMTLEQWRKIMDVNLGGTFVTAHRVLPIMREQGYGRIVTVSSGTTLLGTPGQSAYIASKSGIIGFTRVLAREGGAAGIAANCVLPGLMATDHVLKMRDDVDEFFAMVTAQQCVPRQGQPGDIADAIAYLASEGASFVTGQSLYVGGGDRFI